MTIENKEVAALAINGKAVQLLTINGEYVYGSQKDLSICTIEAVESSVLYTGKPVKTLIEIVDEEEAGGTLLVEGKDYTLEWFDNIEVGTARAVAKGKGGYKGTLQTVFEVKSNDISTNGYDFEIDPTAFPSYASSFDVQIVAAIDSAFNRMVEGVDFIQSNDNAGTVTITGIGKYTGSTTRTYRIINVVNYLTFTSSQDNSTIALNAVGTPDPISLEYCTNNEDTWQPYTVGDTLTIANGQKVKFRGNNSTFSKGDNDYYNFAMTGKIAASGSVMTLIDQANDYRIVGNYMFAYLFKDCASLETAPELPATQLANYYYRNMFQGCTSLTTAPALPATTLANSCYQSMFYRCSSLTTAPALPATTLANSCYQSMFHSCTSLTTAPALPATTLATRCYKDMFNGCSSLTQAPELPATTLAYYCYEYMFQGCTSLTTAPALPATTLSVSCYKDMFNGCSSLTQAPELPAATLTEDCYRAMFYNCTSLTTAPDQLPAATLLNNCYALMFYNCTSLTTAPALPATTLANGCYSHMFYHCTNLNHISVRFTEWNSNATQNWVQNVAASGTFVCPAALPDERGTSRIPYNWTKQDAA